jgi:hypothetical protein
MGLGGMMINLRMKDEGGRMNYKDEGGRMKDENKRIRGLLLTVFILHPSSFRLYFSSFI